jgi:hypothetical protein
MKYLVDYIDHFKFNFNYKFTSDEAVKSVSLELKASAIGKDASGQPVTISLLDTGNTSGATANVTFDFVPAQISGDITIEVDVYPTVQTSSGTIFESFSQTLTITSAGPIYEIAPADDNTQDGAFGTLTYHQSGQLGYAVYTKATSPLGAVVLSPPPTSTIPTATQPETTVGPEAPVYINLIDQMNGSFSYQFQSDQQVQNLTETVSITAIIAGGNLWSKSVVVLPQTSENGPFTLSFPMDINGMNQLLGNIKTETGASGTSDTLTFRVDVTISAQSAYGIITDTFSPSLSTSMDNGSIQWNESLNQSKSGSITASEIVPNNSRYIGMSVRTVRIFSIALACLIFVIFVLLAYLSFKPALPKDEGDLVDKKFGERMARAKTQTTANGITTVSLDSMEDLVKVADELAKPIISEPPVIPTGSQLYYVVDGTTRYQYSIGGEENPPIEIKPD